jgi:hypothetical protein
VKFNTFEILTLGCAIFRTTNGVYVSKALSEQQSTAEKYVNTNRELMIRQLFPVADTVLIDILDEDKVQCQNIIKHFHRLTFKILNETINPFEQKILTIIDTDTVTLKEFTIISYIPMAYAREITRLDFLKIIKDTTGALELPINSRIETFCHIIDIKHISSVRYNSSFYAYTAITSQGNLIEFTNSNKISDIGTDIQISGKIKEHTTHYQTSKPLSRINYVKILRNC